MKTLLFVAVVTTLVAVVLGLGLEPEEEDSGSGLEPETCIRAFGTCSSRTRGSLGTVSISFV